MTTSSRPKNVALVLAVIAIGGLVPACYTLFQHPRLASLNYARPADKQCLNCHSADQLAQSLRPANSKSHTEAWSDYYDEPWWFHSFMRGDSTQTNHSTDTNKDRR